MTYTAETIPSEVVQHVLYEQWQTYSGVIPRPNFFDVNGEDRELRVNLQEGDYVIISTEVPALQETPIGNHTYGHRETNVQLVLYTISSRQRLWDMMREVRRIFHARRHSLSEYQKIQFNDFQEMVDEQAGLWMGRIRVSLVNNAVLLETT